MHIQPSMGWLDGVERHHLTHFQIWLWFGGFCKYLYLFILSIYIYIYLYTQTFPRRNLVLHLNKWNTKFIQGQWFCFFAGKLCVSWVLGLVALGLSTLHRWKFWDQKSDCRHGVCGVPIQAERQDKLSSSRATSWAFHAKMFWGFRLGPVDVQGFYQSPCMSVFPPNTLLRMSRPALHSGLTDDARGRKGKPTMVKLSVSVS